MTSSNKPVATAVLAVYNSEITITDCLKSLLSQSVPIEIIVVDDGSTDNTVSSMVRTIELFPKSEVKLLRQSHGGPALARNLGAQHATTPILLFVDSDMTFDRDYVKGLIYPITSLTHLPKIIGTYTTEERVSNWDNVWARCWNYAEGWEDGLRFPANPPKWGTDYRAILKSEFDRVGGFDNIGYTDTWSLFAKLKQRPLATRAICYHKNPDTLSAVFRQAKWAAKRPYKFGFLGNLYALLRASLPVSLVVGIYTTLSRRTPAYLPFRFVYDLGRCVGILEMLLTGKLTK